MRRSYAFGLTTLLLLSPLYCGKGRTRVVPKLDSTEMPLGLEPGIPKVESPVFGAIPNTAATPATSSTHVASLATPASSSIRSMTAPVQGRRGVPNWSLNAEFAEDAFTFARVRYESYGRRWHSEGDWATDWPDSDLNFSFRLQQLTALKVNPNGCVVDLGSPQMFEYPFLYLIEPGQMLIEKQQALALQRYCLNGGFLMVDDFWGSDEWDHFNGILQQVFPDRNAIEVPLSHEIFHIVYDLKEKPQIPSLHSAQRGRSQGITWERGNDTRTPHYRAIYDDQDRIMVFICHNTDLGDGWEREGEDEWYFREFSEKKAYPLGINIVTYALTH